MKVIFSQSDLSKEVINNELTFELNEVTTAETLIGNFFEIVSDFKDANARLFNFSKPILLKVINETSNLETKETETETILDTSLALKGLQQKCKLQWTKKGRTKFKNNIAICLRASQRKMKAFTVNEFNELNERLG